MKWSWQIPDMMSRRSAFLLFNGLSLLLCLWKGQIKSDWLSIIALTFAFGMMNAIAWWSSRNFPQWSKTAAKPDRDEAQDMRVKRSTSDSGE
jgi:hypothetical protein